MCLIVFAWQVIPGMPLVAAANRDEFFDRPALPAAWWEDHPGIYAGRDLRAKGAWLGISKTGRFAAVTNIRAPVEKRADAPSRGDLVADYLKDETPAQEYVARVAQRAHRYNGFNLLVGDTDMLIWYSNGTTGDERNGKPLAPGIYGLSNAALDISWPKVVRTKAQFASLLCQGAPDAAYFEMLADTTQAPDCKLPGTGIGLERERLLSAVRIEAPGYGTRASTLVRLQADGSAQLLERTIR